MFKNYFKTAFRNFGRNKVFSFINVSGLMIGISASLVIYMIVSYEFSFDKFEKDGNRVYRVVSDMMFPGNAFKLSGAPEPMGEAMRQKITGLEIVAKFETMRAGVTVAGKSAPVKFIKQEKIIFADDNYFKLFNYTWLGGSPAVLQQPFKTVLTVSRAKQYFGTADVNSVIGKTVTYNDSVKVTVAGIVEDNMAASDVTFKEFISRSTITNSNLKNEYSLDAWSMLSSSSQLFVKLAPTANAQQVLKQVQRLQDASAQENSLKINHKLQPLADIHFDAEYDNFNERQSQKNVMYGLLAVAAFLLLLGCINFINLTTSQASQRAKEIGIRKTMGSTKKQLVLQFLTETFVLTLVATTLSVLVTPLLLKAFAGYIPAGVSFNMIMQPHVLAFLLLLVIMVSVLSGFYPALILSGFKPIAVLKNQVVSMGGATSRRVILRKGLTVAQFVIAQFFIIGTIVVSKQIHYAINADLGYKKDAIINIETPYYANAGKKEVLLGLVKQMPGVQNALLAGEAPASSGISASLLVYQKGKKEIQTTVEVKRADSAYFAMYNMKLLGGRYLRLADSTGGMLINETYAHTLGFIDAAKAVGEYIGTDKKIPVTGVLADVHTKSMHSAIQPMAYSVEPRNYRTLHIALKPRSADGSNWKTTIAKTEAAWKQLYPDDNFSYQFLDDTIAKFYTAEQSTSTLLTWATGLAVFISCLGLLGLAIYTTNQRTKEIGVRKVLGATIQQIVLLLSKDFVQLIILAIIIAVPLAWWAMHNWLQAYPYHTGLSWWVFAVSGGGLILIAFIVLSLRTVRAASANPVKALKVE